MKFYHKKTGATLDLPLENPGGEWVPADKADVKEEATPQKVEAPQKAKAPSKPVKKEAAQPREGITKKDIMQELDAFGVEYDPKGKKDDLLKLMKEQCYGANNR